VILKDNPIPTISGILGFGFLGVLLIPEKIRNRYIELVITLFIIYIFSIFFGSFIINPFLEEYGEKGEGIIVDISQTSNMYNEQPVLRYNVIIKSADSKIYSTYFFSNDFNVSPSESWNSYAYPPAGKKFNVWYLKEKPRVFVIIANDDSEYCKWLNKIKIAKEINKLRYKLKMDQENIELKKQLESLLNDYNK
jgi:hypothetical protein